MADISYSVRVTDAAGQTVVRTITATTTVPSGTFVWQGVNTVFPSAATTGPRIARVAAPSGNVSGNISGKKFTGVVRPANGTVFTDCEFVGSGGNWGIDGDGRTFTVDHCKMTSNGGPAAILGCATVLASDISGWEDGIKTQGNGWIIRGNYIHGPFKTSSSHNDGIQIQWSNSNGLVEQNRIEWTDTSEVFCQELDGQISNIIIRHNRLAGSDLPIRVEAGCTGCQVYQNMVKPGTWGWSDLNPQVTHSGNIRPDGTFLD